MRHQAHPNVLLSVFVAVVAFIFSANVFAVDAETAQTLARQNGCFKCHAIEKKSDKKKDGPAWTEIAAKYRGKANAESQLITHITTGEKAKFPDGHEEEHKIIKTKDMVQIKNLVGWILSL